METYQQCLVFVFEDPTEAEDNGNFIILPEVFLREHSNVQELLRTNHICVLNEGNVSRLFVDKRRLHAIEIHLLTNPRATDFPLFVMGPDICKLIIKYLFSNTTVIESDSYRLNNPRPAVDDTNLSVVKLLLANSEALTDIQWCLREDESGSLLHLAVYRGHVALARALLEHGLDLNGGSDGCRPLDYALRAKSPDMVQLVIDHGANINPDEDGDTFLHKSFDFRSSEILIQNGVDVNGMANGITPLHHASHINDFESVKALLNYGARTDLKDGDNHSVLDYWGVMDKLYRYLLERCFTKFDALKDALDLTKIISRIRGEPDLDFMRPSWATNKIDILASHVFKIAALEDRLSDDLCRRLAELATPDSRFDEFVSECKEEVDRMANQKIVDTQVSFTELLAKNELQVARLLNNESVAQIVDSEEFSAQFPSYETILSLHLEKGKLRKFIQAEGIKSLDALSRHFRKLPDAPKEKIVSFLGLLEAQRLKKASVCPQTPVLG